MKRKDPYKLLHYDISHSTMLHFTAKRRTNHHSHAGPLKCKTHITKRRDAEIKKSVYKSSRKYYRLAATHLSAPRHPGTRSPSPRMPRDRCALYVFRLREPSSTGPGALNTCLKNCPSRGILIFIATGMLISQGAADACTDGHDSP